jgi:hypothetical protein
MTRLGFIYCGIGRKQPVHYPEGQAGPRLEEFRAPSLTAAG